MNLIEVANQMAVAIIAQAAQNNSPPVVDGPLGYIIFVTLSGAVATMFALTVKTLYYERERADRLEAALHERSRFSETEMAPLLARVLDRLDDRDRSDQRRRSDR